MDLFQINILTLVRRYGGAARLNGMTIRVPIHVLISDTGVYRQPTPSCARRPLTLRWKHIAMPYGPGFGLPDLMSKTSEIRQAITDLEAEPPAPIRDGQLIGLKETLKIRLEDEAAGRPTGPFQAPTE